MSNRCTDNVICPHGDCPGCLNGETWCYDPRCAPYCVGTPCTMPPEHDFILNIVMASIIIGLCAIFFIIWYVFGPNLFEQHDDYRRAKISRYI